MKGIYETMLELMDRGTDGVLTTIVSEEGSSPRGTGAQMLSGPEGLAAGSIGGGASEAQALLAAGRLLEAWRGDPRQRALQQRCRLRHDPNARENPVCGGEIGLLSLVVPHDSLPWRQTAETLLARRKAGLPSWLLLDLAGGPPALAEASGAFLAGAGPIPAAFRCPAQEGLLLGDRFVLPVLPGKRAVLFGAGHCAQALAPLLASVGFRVTVFDDRPEFACRARFPAAEAVILGDFRRVAGFLTLTEEDYALVMTTGHAHDYEVQSQILRAPLAYVGVIGSRTKTAYVNQRLREDGIPEEVLRQIHAPIGLAIRAVTPEEIAVSIAAEVILHRALRRSGEAPGSPLSLSAQG